jgi:hypothetical protein
VDGGSVCGIQDRTELGAGQIRPAVLSPPHHRSSGNSFPNCFKRNVPALEAALNAHRRLARAIIRLWGSSRVSLKSWRGLRLSANACEPRMNACGEPWPIPRSSQKRNSLHLPADAPAARTPPYAAAALTHVILHHCVAAAKGVLGFQPVPDPLMLQPIRGLAVRSSCPVGQFMSDSGV